MAGKPGRPRSIPPLANHAYDHDKARMVGRQDSWQNWVTGVGNAQFDKTVNSFYQKDLKVDDDQLTGLYYGNDIAKLIVDSYVDEAFRCGYELNIPDDQDNSQKDELDQWKPAIDTAARDLLRWSRLFGGAAIYLDVEDGQAVIEPLQVDKVKKINSLRVFDRRYVWPLGYDSDPTSPTYWLPEYYGFGGSLTGSITAPRVHHSRLLRAVGIEADRREAQYLFWWGHSVLQPVFTAIRNFGLGEASVITMMQDATQFIFYVKGLIDAVTNGDAAAIQQRMQLIDLQRSTNRALLLDAGDGSAADSEHAEKQTTPFTGVADMLTFFMSRVASAARMPLSILFGTGLGKGGGIGDKGEGDLRTWHSKIQSYQTTEVEPILRRLYALVAATLGIDISKMKFNWAQLYEPTGAEKATIYLQTAQADQIYMQEGAIRPEEVAISRWGSGKYSTDTSIDVGMYRAALMQAPMPQPQIAAPGQPGAPGQPPAPGQPGAPGQPPAPGQPATGAPAPGPVTAGPVTPPEKPDVNAANPATGKHPNEGPLTGAEVGGSSKTAAEPQIVDVTGRGTPKKDQEPNKLPADVSGTTPNDTPVQAKAPASDQIVPAGDQGPKKNPKGPSGDEISVTHGQTKIKIKSKNDSADFREDAKMGSKEKVANNIEKYIEKGGSIKSLGPDPVSKTRNLDRQAKNATDNALYQRGGFSKGFASKEESQSAHEKAAKAHGEAAKAHEVLAANLGVHWASELAAHASVKAHETGEAEDHAKAAYLHQFAANQLSHGKVKEQHEAYAKDHQLLAGRGYHENAGKVSSEPMFNGKDPKEVTEQKEQHEKIAEYHRSMQESHATESKKEDPATSDAEWDEAKHPRDEQGRFT